MKLINLISARGVFQKLDNKPVSPRLAYKIMKFLKSTDEDAAFYDKQLRSIAEKYGCYDGVGNLVEENGLIRLDPKTVEEASKKIKELEETEAECSVSFHIGEFDELKISAADMFSLADFITEEG